jgi:hypothetical protein
MVRIRPTVHLTLAVLLTALGGGASIATTQQPGQGRATPPPPVPPQYAFLYDEGITGEDAWNAARRTFPYESISLARRGCFGTCPVYSVTIRADGGATYTGERNGTRIGTYSGRTYFGDFARLAMFIEQSGFMKFSARYTAPHTDDETVVVTVVMRDGTTKSVSNYGRYGPLDLWVLERAIDGVVEEMKWTSGGRGGS